jgi:AraC-like DNA-binding protein
MDRTAEFPVRPEWMYEVRSACQAFECLVFQADRPQFEVALRRLCETTPAARTLQEADALKDRLKICTFDAGTAFHQEYHRHPPRRLCLGSAVEAALRAWCRHDDDPRVTLSHWTTVFLSTFDATHPSTPAERAAAVLRARFTSPPDLDTLALETGCFRSGLTRGFKQRYGISSREYLTRYRLRWFIEAVRKPGSNAGRLAEEAGYGSYHNLVDALRQRTSLTPREVCRLTDDEARELGDTKLALCVIDVCSRQPARRPSRRGSEEAGS